MGRPGSLVYCGTFVVSSAESSILSTSSGKFLATHVILHGLASLLTEDIPHTSVTGLRLHNLPKLGQLESFHSSFAL